LDGLVKVLYYTTKVKRFFGFTLLFGGAGDPANHEIFEIDSSTKV